MIVDQTMRATRILADALVLSGVAEAILQGTWRFQKIDVAATGRRN